MSDDQWLHMTYDEILSRVENASNPGGWSGFCYSEELKMWVAVNADGTCFAAPDIFQPTWSVVPWKPAVCPVCDCGAAKAKTTHSDWCSTLKPPK